MLVENGNVIDFFWIFYNEDDIVFDKKRVIYDIVGVISWFVMIVSDLDIELDIDIYNE